MKQRKVFNFFINLLFISFFFYILWDADWHLINIFLTKISIESWIFATISFFLVYFFKALRFHILNQLSLKKLIPLTLAHNFFLAVLPLRSGEFVFLKEVHEYGITLTKAATDLFLARVNDLIVILFIGGLTLFIQTTSVKEVWFFFNIFSFIVLVLLLFFMNKWLQWLQIILEKVASNKYFWMHQKFKELLKITNNISFQKKIYLIIATFLIWITIALPWLIILDELFDLSYIALFSIVVISFSSKILPFNPPAGVGMVNGIWYGALVLNGVDSKEALPFSIFAHSLSLLQVSLFYGLWQTYALVTKKRFINV